MKKATFINLLDDTLLSLRSLSEGKGREYASDDDHLSNFKRLGERLGLAPEAINQVYLAKHLDSISCYVRSLNGDNSYTSSEPISGRIDDAILYLILLKALISEREENQHS